MRYIVPLSRSNPSPLDANVFDQPAIASPLLSIMKSSARVAGLMVTILFVACDNITGLDNRDPPSSPLTGRVIFQGELVGVRNNGVQLELWEPAYEERYGQRVKIPIYVHQDGTFATMLYDGTYKLNLLSNNGPWANSADTTLIVVSGGATVDVPVRPYYTIVAPTFTRGAPTTAVPGGSISTTFRVGQIDTSRQLEYVGLYVGVTSFVDRINSVSIPQAQRERVRTAIQPQLDANGDITISVNLPATIYQSNSPWVRDFVYVRVGVKTVGVTEMLFSPVYEVAL